MVQAAVVFVNVSPPEVLETSIGKKTSVRSVSKSKQLGLDKDESSVQITGGPAVGGSVRTLAMLPAMLPAADLQDCAGAGTGSVGNWDSGGTTLSGWSDEGCEGVIM
jgi:hypothetical protein